MKFRNLKRTVVLPALGLLTGIVLFASCSKDHSTPTPVVAPGSLAIYHASPGAPELAFKINGVTNKLKPFTFGTFLTYANIEAGNYELSFTKKDSARVLSKLTASIKSSKFYTLHVADVLAKQTVILTEDDLSAPATDKAKVRFINLSPDAPALDISIAGKTDPLFKNTAFKAATAFASADPAAEVTFQVTETSKTDVLAKIEKVKIEKGKIYTIYAKGLKAATDSTKLGVTVITNK